ncbi:DUF6301 family protein [Nocardia carnea]|uniref:DUF6301 family protein n=1 Tax=Nocardia carnea TaxID=37328 RepID=A0ABW7TPZ3_9NOCA
MRQLGRDGVVDEIEVMLTDFADQDNVGRDGVRDTFAWYAAAITEVLGEPTRRLPGDVPEVRWAGTYSTVFLRATSIRVSLNLATNKSIEFQDMAAEMQDVDDLDSDIWGSA